jgi:hypothetical protein
VIYSVKELNSIFLEHKEICRILSVETIVSGAVLSSAARILQERGLSPGRSYRRENRKP